MVLAAAALSLTACGADKGGADVASVSNTGTKPAASASATLDNQAKALKFAQCLREQGVDVPDPAPDGKFAMKFGPDTDQAKVEKAMEACKQFQPSGVSSGKGADPKQAEEMRKQAQCMRDNGVEAFPDPDGGMMRITPEIGEDPDFKAAQEKCHMGMGGS
jgi:hypothetical protein